MTLYRETTCEHGHMEEHYTCDHISYQEYNQISHTNENCQCSGGSREEVTIDYEATARCRWDARFGKGSWDHPDEGPATDEQVQYTHAAFLNSAKRDVDAALHTERETASTVGVQP